jgi:hypothetical protein
MRLDLVLAPAARIEIEVVDTQVLRSTGRKTQEAPTVLTLVHHGLANPPAPIEDP